MISLLDVVQDLANVQDNFPVHFVRDCEISLTQTIYLLCYEARKPNVILCAIWYRL